jgi:lipoprotein NlpD
MRGETLYAIAFRYDQDYRRLAALNQLSAPYTLAVGQVLQLKESARTSFFSSAKLVRRPMIDRPHHRVDTVHVVVPSRALVAITPKNERWVWPLKGRIYRTFSPSLGRKGIDIAGRKGDRIYAAASGVVAYAGSGLSV